MSRRLLYLIIFILVLVAATEIILPAAVGKIVAQGMVSQTGSDAVSADVEKSPALLMLTGNFDKIVLTAANAKTDKITFSDFKATLTDVRLDMNTLLSKRLIALKSVGGIDVAASISETELARYINQNVKGVKNAAVTINPDKIQATSSVSFGNLATVNITIEGRVAVDGQRVKFVAERFMLNNSPVGSIGGMTMTDITLVEVQKLPFNVTVRDVVTEKGKIVIYADNKAK